MEILGEILLRLIVREDFFFWDKYKEEGCIDFYFSFGGDRNWVLRFFVLDLRKRYA